MITRDDHVKILDFGLAKTTASQHGRLAARTTQLADTTPGTVLGTFGYMAPEQVRGLAVDHRADMFAFGAVLYEMLSGQRAFRGETAADTMTAILTREPPDLDLAKLAIPPASIASSAAASRRPPTCAFSPRTISPSRSRTLTTTSGTTSGIDDRRGRRSGAAPAMRASRASVLPWMVAAVTAVAAVRRLVAARCDDIDRAALRHVHAHHGAGRRGDRAVALS